jgi:hypothetical protein
LLVSTDKSGVVGSDLRKNQALKEQLEVRPAALTPAAKPAIPNRRACAKQKEILFMSGTANWRTTA